MTTQEEKQVEAQAELYPEQESLGSPLISGEELAKLFYAREQCEKLNSQLEWLWNNCQIIYHPKNGKGYVLYEPELDNKGARELIEAEMMKSIEPNYAASFGGDTDP